ncbi:hypothetical protein BTE77_35685, partial [Ensifer adhaerens]
TTADMTTSRATTLNASGGTFETVAGTTLAHGGVIAGAGALTKAGAGTLTLTGDNSYTGPTTVANGTLAAGATNSFSGASAYTVGASGTLALQSFNQMIASLNNQGSVRLAANPTSTPGTVLTISGNYTGTGALFINTVLEGDNSPTDQFVVLGDTSGLTQLQVNNVGGAGGQTIEGIKVIDVAGASIGQFSLIGDFITENDEQAVVAGAYAYTLHQNGIATPGDGDWYLRSQLVENEPGPRFNPGVPLYESYPQILLDLNSLPTMQQRIGNRYWAGAGNTAEGQGDAGGPERGPSFFEATGIWGRIEASHSSYDPAVTSSDTSRDVNLYRLQSGIDFGLHEAADGSLLVAGLNLQYARAAADVASPHGSGDIHTDGYGLGASLTWLAASGFYLDAQAQLSFYDSNLSSTTASQGLVSGNDAIGYALSIEGGQRIDLGNGLTVTPQAQLSYSDVKFDSFHDAFGAAVRHDDGDSLRGRVGLSL